MEPIGDHVRAYNFQIEISGVAVGVAKQVLGLDAASPPGPAPAGYWRHARPSKWPEPVRASGVNTTSTQSPTPLEGTHRRRPAQPSFPLN
jgi:hypothetical protein